MRGRKAPTAQSFQKYAVDSGLSEVIYSPLYDYQSYALAGTTTSYTFFQVPVGQSGKTLEDTNMESAGQLPAGKSFIIEGIQVVMFPGVAASVQGAQAVSAFLNDLYTLGKAGYLKLFIGSKDYLIDGPIGKFTQQFGVAGFSSVADVTTAGAALQHRDAMGAWRGQYYAITPVTLKQNTNFSVSLNFPTTTAISANLRIGVILDGSLARRA